MSTDTRLPLREKLAYGFGDLASVLYWQTFMVYLTFFYTDVFGLGAAAVGTMLGLSRSLDAFLDPVVGMLADRTQTRWGTFRPYLLWLAVPFAAMGVLTFTVPALEGSGKLVWAWVTYNALMVLYTGINIPYTAMLGVITPNAVERTALSSVKFVFAFAAGMLISATLLPMVQTLGAGDAARGWQRSFMVIGALAISFFGITFVGTKERIARTKEQSGSVLQDLRDLFRNGPWLILLGATLLLILFIAVRGSVTIHYFKYVVGPRTLTLPSALPRIGGTQHWSLEALVSVFNTSGQLASLCGVLLLPLVTRRIGRKVGFVAMFLIAIACTAAFYGVRPEQVWLLLGLNVIGSLCGGPLSALLWAMYADTADYGEWKTGRRATGLVFSASAFSQKQGWALGAWAALSLLSNVGFVANQEQSSDTLQGLTWLMSLVPAGFGLLSVLVLLLYPLDERTMSRIGDELEARREAARATS